MYLGLFYFFLSGNVFGSSFMQVVVFIFPVLTSSISSIYSFGLISTFQIAVSLSSLTEIYRYRSKHMERKNTVLHEV